MKVLGIETATSLCGVGLADDSGFVADYGILRGYIHAEYLPRAIATVLEGAAWETSDLDGLAVSIGPGSFTGLRIGLGLAKGMAFSLNLPLVAVPTLDALAVRAPAIASHLCVMLTARKVEAYVGLYVRHENRWVLDGDTFTQHVDDLANHMPDEPLLFVGEGARRFEEIIRQRVNEPLFLDETLHPSGQVIAALGRERLGAGQADEAEALIPLYLKRFQGVA